VIEPSNSMNIDLKARVRMPKDLLIQEIEGESILLNLVTENYFALEEVGTSIVCLSSFRARRLLACDTSSNRFSGRAIVVEPIKRTS
jgi:hypothetical protein